MRRSILAVSFAVLVVVSMPATAAVGVGTSTHDSRGQPSDLEVSTGDRPGASSTSGDRSSGVSEQLGGQDNETGTAEGSFSLKPKEYQPLVTSDTTYEMTVIVRNTGPVADEQTVTLGAIEEVQDSERVRLEPGERREVTLTWRPTNAAGQFRWTVRTEDDALDGWVFVENRQVGIEYGDLRVQSGSAAVVPKTREVPTMDNWGQEPIQQWESSSRPFMIKVDTSQFADTPRLTVNEVRINGERAQTIVDQRDYRKEIDSYDSSPATIQVELSDEERPSDVIVSGQHTWQLKNPGWVDPFDSLVGSNLDEQQDWVALADDWDEGQTEHKVRFAKGSFKTVDQQVLPHPQCSALIDVSQQIEGQLGARIGQQPAISGTLGGSGSLQANCIEIALKGKGTLQFVGGGELDKASIGISVTVTRNQEFGVDAYVGEITLQFSYGIEVSGTATFQELWAPDKGSLSLKGVAGVTAKTELTGGYEVGASGSGKIGPKFGFGGTEAVVTYEGVEGSFSIKVYIEGDWVSWTILEYQQSGTLAQPLSDGFQEVEQKHLMPAGGFDRLVVEPGTPFATHTRVTNRTVDDVVPAVTAAPAVTDDLAVITGTQSAGGAVYTRNLVKQEYDAATGEWATGPQITNDSSRIPGDTAIDAGNGTAVLAASFNSLPANLSDWSFDDYLADPLSSVGFLSHDGGSWGPVRTLTNSSSFHRAPDAAVTRTGDAAIAYEVYREPPSRELNPVNAAGEIAYHLVTNGTVTANRSLANATSPVLDTASGSVLLSYYDNETDAVVTGTIHANGTFTRTDQYSVSGKYLDHAMDGEQLVIGTLDEQDLSNVTIRHVDNGTVEELPTVPLVSAGDFEFDSGGNRSVLSYTGLIENGTRGTDAIRQVESNGTWSEPLLLSGGLSTNVSAYQPTQTIAAGDPTVAYVAREQGVGPPPLQENRTASDVFLTRVNSTSLLAIDDLQAPDASTGENVTVTATVRNAGSESGSGDLVVLGDDGTQLASTTVSLAPQTSTTESFDNLEVPESGTFSATIQGTDTDAQTSTVAPTSTHAQSNWSPWVAENASVQVARSNLSVSAIEAQASSVTDGTVTVTLENNGSAFATDELVRLEDNASLVSDKTVPDIPPGGNATLSWDVEPASLDLSGQAAVTIDPESSLVPDEFSLLFEPTLSIDGDVTYHNTSNGTTVLFNLNNTGVGTAYDVQTTMYNISTFGTMSELGTRSIERIPGRGDRYAPIQLSNVTDGQFHTLVVDPWGQRSQLTSLFVVTVLQDNFSVDAIESDRSGDQLTVTTNVTNTGTNSSEQVIELAIDGETRAQTLVSRTPGESGNVTLTTDTSDVETLSSVTVSSLDDADELRSSFAVSNLTLEKANVSRGEGINVSADLANVGELAGQREISLLVNGTAVATRTVELGAGNGTAVTFRNATLDLPPRNYELRVESGDDSAVATVTVGDSRGYACSIADANDEVTTVVLLAAIDDWRNDEITLSWLFDVIDDWRAGSPLNC